MNYVRNYRRIKIFLQKFQELSLNAYMSSCSEKHKNVKRQVLWWNRKLETLRSRIGRLYNKAIGNRVREVSTTFYKFSKKMTVFVAFFIVLEFSIENKKVHFLSWKNSKLKIVKLHSETVFIRVDSEELNATAHSSSPFYSKGEGPTG